MIRETRAVSVASSVEEVRRAVTFALIQEGFEVARHEPGYVEARRGNPSPMRVVSLMKVESTPVVVCVALEGTETGGARVNVGAYPDLGPAVLMGPVARRKWRPAMESAVTIVCQAALGWPATAPHPAA